MRSRAVAIAVFALGAALLGAMAPAQQDGDQGARHAEQVARAALARHLNIGIDEITVTRTRPRTWNDSNMGCGAPGSMALQVIMEGYAVALRAQERDHRVHVSGENAIVCERSARSYGDPRRGLRAQGVSQATELARNDLAQRLKVEPGSIRITNVRPQRWPDSGLGCPRPDEQVVSAMVSGFRMTLVLDSRAYTYHATATQARACPAIEVD